METYPTKVFRYSDCQVYVTPISNANVSAAYYYLYLRYQGADRRNGTGYQDRRRELSSILCLYWFRLVFSYCAERIPTACMTRASVSFLHGYWSSIYPTLGDCLSTCRLPIESKDRSWTFCHCGICFMAFLLLCSVDPTEDTAPPDEEDTTREMLFTAASSILALSMPLELRPMPFPELSIPLFELRRPLPDRRRPDLLLPERLFPEMLFPDRPFPVRRPLLLFPLRLLLLLLLLSFLSGTKSSSIITFDRLRSDFEGAN